MDLRFADSDLWALCNSAEATVRSWNENRAQIVRQRLQEVEGVPSLADLDALPYVRIESREDGCFAVSAGDGVDLVLRPAQAGTGRSDANDWTKVTAVTLIAVLNEGHVD